MGRFGGHRWGGSVAAYGEIPMAAVSGPDNRHPESDQWVFIVSGIGTAIVEEAVHDLSPGTLLLIEAGEAHELKSGSQEPLTTVNIYAPPEY